MVGAVDVAPEVLWVAAAFDRVTACWDWMADSWAAMTDAELDEMADMPSTVSSLRAVRTLRGNSGLPSEPDRQRPGVNA